MADHIRELEAEEVQEEAYDTSDPKQVNTARKKDARNKAVRMKFVASAMSFPEGRAWFYDLLVHCKVFKTPFTDDPYTTAFNCGQHNTGLRILDDIQTAAPTEYVTMINENNR